MRLFQANGAQLKELTTHEIDCLSFDSKKSNEKVVQVSLNSGTVPSGDYARRGKRTVRKRNNVKKVERSGEKLPVDVVSNELSQSVANSTLVQERIAQVPDEDSVIEPGAEELKRIEREFCLEKMFTSKGRNTESLKHHGTVSGFQKSRENGVVDLKRVEQDRKEVKKRNNIDSFSQGSKDIVGSDKLNEAQSPWRGSKSFQKSVSPSSFISNCHVIPKLSFEEEVDICNQIQLLRTWERERDRVSELLGRNPTLAEWAEAVGFSDSVEFARKIKGLRESKDKIIHSNLRLVYYIARFYSKYGLSLQDLMQEGSIGLIKAAERFDSSKGFRFGSYAIWWIKYAMTRALTEQTRHWRIPAYFYEFMSTIRRTDSKLTAELGREPTQEEVFKESGLTIEQFQTANRCLLHSLSLDSPLSYEYGDKRTTLGDTVAGDVLHPEDELENNMLRRDLEKILEMMELVRRWMR
ncbi:RNA polymerase sigma factor SigA [Galdieria sulphuraria]|nr:RNA polymerase sigma factor SigA [Galdieria sulphuraria]